jgi:hypothetical protein
MVSPAQIGQMQMPLQQGQDPVEPVYNYTYGEARSADMAQYGKTPAQQAAIDAALAKGPPQGYLDNIAAEELRLSSLLASAGDPYKGTRFEGFTGLGNDGYGSRSQGPEDRVLSDGFFVNDPRRPRPGMRGSSDSGIPAIPNPASDINSALKALGMTPSTRDPDKADFYAFKNTLRDPGDMGRYVGPGEEMSYEDFVKFGRPANLVAAESAGYRGGALLSDGYGNNVSLGSLVDNANLLKDATGMPDFRGPVDPFARPTAGMLGPTTEINPIAEPPTSPQPDVTKPPMPTGGLAGLTQLPMFQDFATKLEAEHPEASQLFSQMFMGSSQRPMPYQNPFMGMGMGSFHPMMGMGMGGYSPMMGMGGGFHPMMGGMGMGGYSPFMGMNPFMGGGFNPMMGMGGGGLGSFYPQPSTYGPPQSMPSMGGYPTPPQSSPFGGAMRGYYA